MAAATDIGRKRNRKSVSTVTNHQETGVE